MAKIHMLTARVSFAWWWKPYICGVILASWLTGMQPDPERVGYWMKRAARIHIEGVKR